MDIGIFVFQTGYSMDPAVLAKRAEELGFESFWVPNLPIWPVDAQSREAQYAHGVMTKSSGPLHDKMPLPASNMAQDRIVDTSAVLDPFVALSRASGVTKTIKLGTGVCLVPEHNPLLLAKQVATLDHLSGGRFIFGIGAGGRKEESEIMGSDFPHRWTQTRDAVLAMKELWTKEESEYHGTYYDFPPVRSFPKPVQKPHPPIFLGGMARNALERVIDYGDGWMPARAARILESENQDFVDKHDIERGRETLNDLAQKAGRNPASIQVVAFGGPGQYRTREAIKDLEQAGADRVTIWLEHSGGNGALEEIEELARQLLV